MASCGGSGNKGKAEAGTPLVARSAAEVAGWLGLGWNLGNQYDAFDNGVASDTAWDNPPATKALFDSLAAAGFTSVRIPVTWLGHIGIAPDYKLDEAWLARVGQAVGYAEQAGLKAIVNIHHDGADRLLAILPTPLSRHSSGRCGRRLLPTSRTKANFWCWRR